MMHKKAISILFKTFNVNFMVEKSVRKSSHLLKLHEYDSIQDLKQVFWKCRVLGRL